MKKHILSFALLMFLITQTKAQTSVYHPFPDSNAMWCCSWYDVSPTDCINNYTVYTLGGQTQINGIIYDSLLEFSVTIAYNSYCMPVDTIIIKKPYFIRQDTALKTVWISDPTLINESVLYNFNLNVGDTLDATKVYWGPGVSPYVITSIDSIFMYGNYRKRYNYGTGCGWFSSDTSMIEGIGALHGLMFPPSCFEYTYHLDAFSEDNIDIFGDTIGSCYGFLTGSALIKSKEEISIYPNPVNDKLIIKSSGLIYRTINIYNVLGQETSPPASLQRRGEDASIDVSKLAAGIYFLQLKSESGSVVRKFVKSSEL